MPLVLAAPAPVPVDAVAPPLGIAIRQSNEQVRDDGRGVRRFRSARTLVFAEEASGFRLTVTQRSAGADTDPAERRRYALANAPLIGRPIVMHLDRSGRLLSIDDLDAVWRAWTSGLVAAAPPGTDPKADALLRRFGGMTAAQRLDAIGSIADALFVAPDERRPAPPRPVQLASPPPFNDLKLTGTVAASAEGSRVRIRMAASGQVSAGAGPRSGSVAVAEDRLADPATGLLVRSSRRQTLSGPTAKLVTVTSSDLTW